MSKQALAGLKVLEWGEGVSGPYCGKLLADLGAEVVKIERPGLGDIARSYGPFLQDIPHREKSGTFLYLNTNKLGITLDVNGPTGAMVFRELVRQVDILIENHAPREVEELGLAFENLKEIKPGLVMTSISPFGQTGPYREYRSCNLVSFHFSGMAYINPSDGVYDVEKEPPLMGPPNQGDLVAGLTGALASVSGVLARRMTGRGHHVDVSQHEALASMTRHQLGNYTVEQFPWVRSKENRAHAASEIYRCADGLVYLICGDARMWERWVEAMGSPDWALSDVFQDLQMRRENWDAAKTVIQEWTAERTVQEVVELAQAARVPCRRLNTVEQSSNSELLGARDHFIEVSHEVAGRLKYAGAPYKLSRTPWRLNRPTPLLGQHNDEVYCGRLGYTRGDLVTLSRLGVI